MPEIYTPDTAEKRPPGSKLAWLFSQMQRGGSRYKELIGQQEKGGGSFSADRVDTPYADYTEQWLLSYRSKYEDRAAIGAEDRAYVQNAIKDGILVDVGGGRGILGRAARELEVGTYINVDKFGGRQELREDPFTNHYNTVYETDTNIVRNRSTQTETEMAMIKDDMLDFVSRLPDNCANFTLNGIDIGGTREYFRALAVEIARATKPGGIIFGHDFYPADFYDDQEFAKEHHIRRHYIKGNFGSIKVFEKEPTN